MTIKDAQHDMRYGYLGGAPGAFASGTVWIIAGIVGLLVSAQASIITLFFGGMLIHPAGMMIAKLLKRPGKHQPDNPLGMLALESTALLFIGLFIGFFVAQIRSEWFFPIMLLMIGGRYLLFATLYGLRTYWGLGGILIVAGGLTLFFSPPFFYGALIGGFVELVFGGLIMSQLSGTQKEA